ncbi:MAG: Gfo/Idh/MocA family oxidoreductase [Pseudomonadota bacterium]
MSGFRVIVAGMGVQGAKRQSHAGADCVACVEPAGGHDFTDLRAVPLDTYDAALLCIPDGPKIDLLGYLVDNGKHALVEKPLFAADDAQIADLQARARATGAVLYTAYNHRFEPHFVAMRDLIAGGTLGRIYRCRMFYGNGTARLVRNSEWRDQGSGVLHDLGSHLLDTAAFWFGDLGEDFGIISSQAYENRAPDHVVFGSEAARPALEFEMTLLNWRNHFTADLFAEGGSAHIASLCKWGPSTLTVRRRVLPAGRPPEEQTTLVQDDPTWAAEYAHFKALCQSGAETDLSKDLWLNRLLERLGDEAIAEAAR